VVVVADRVSAAGRHEGGRWRGTPLRERSGLCSVGLGDVTLQHRATDAVDDFVQRPASDRQEAGEFGMRSGKPLGDVVTHGVDRIFDLSASLEVAVEGRPGRPREDDLPQRVGQLPRDDVGVMPRNPTDGSTTAAAAISRKSETALERFAPTGVRRTYTDQRQPVRTDH
jgi:hypothetical protein